MGDYTLVIKSKIAKKFGREHPLPNVIANNKPFKK